MQVKIISIKCLFFILFFFAFIVFVSYYYPEFKYGCIFNFFKNFFHVQFPQFLKGTFGQFTKSIGFTYPYCLCLCNHVYSNVYNCNNNLFFFFWVNCCVCVYVWKCVYNYCEENMCHRLVYLKKYYSQDTYLPVYENCVFSSGTHGRAHFENKDYYFIIIMNIHNVKWATSTYKRHYFFNCVFLFWFMELLHNEMSVSCNDFTFIYIFFFFSFLSVCFMLYFFICCLGFHLLDQFTASRTTGVADFCV